MSIANQHDTEPQFGLGPDKEPVLIVSPQTRALMDQISWASSFSADDFENHTGFFDKDPIAREHTLYERAQAEIAQGRAIELGGDILHLAS